MKIAGQQNDGAWYRANKFIKLLGQGDFADSQADLVNAMKAIPSFAGFVSAMLDIMGKAGTDGASTEITAEGLSQVYGTKGIPRFVWLGKLAWDTYTKTGAKYKPDHATAVRQFAEDLRTCVKTFQLGLRLRQDLLNVATRKDDNPGGVADATQGT